MRYSVAAAMPSEVPSCECAELKMPSKLQLADAAEVLGRVRRRPGVRYPVLTPNMKASLLATV